ncbi:hypothetical protein LV779_12615 [Streptomyces thinghirensis]|nr:hypothetical protein [Streptomyces thinghirensis]
MHTRRRGCWVEHGSTGLTARRLGPALGADPGAPCTGTSRAWDDLILAIVGRVDGPGPGGWDDDRSPAAGSACPPPSTSAYLAHPQAAVLTASRVTAPAEIAVIEAILGILRGAVGLPDETAVRVGTPRLSSTRAWPSPPTLDVGALPWRRRPARPTSRRWGTTYARLPATSHPPHRRHRPAP